MEGKPRKPATGLRPWVLGISAGLMLGGFSPSTNHALTAGFSIFWLAYFFEVILDGW